MAAGTAGTKSEEKKVLKVDAWDPTQGFEAGDGLEKHIRLPYKARWVPRLSEYWRMLWNVDLNEFAFSTALIRSQSPIIEWWIWLDLFFAPSVASICLSWPRSFGFLAPGVLYGIQARRDVPVRSRVLSATFSVSVPCSKELEIFDGQTLHGPWWTTICRHGWPWDIKMHKYGEYWRIISNKNN